VLEEKKRNLKLGQYEILDAHIPTLSEFAEEYVEYQRDVKRIRSHGRTKEAVNHFKRFYGTKRLNEITPEDVDIYKRRRLDEGVKLGPIARELTAIRHLFNQARRWKRFFGDNPVSASGMPEVHDQKERIFLAQRRSKSF
jgi:site-specific recombinase XerD